MIRIEYIQEFVTLAECLSFSKASEDLFITQPSLSRHISLLESELGVKLVNRSTRSVELTRAGEELYRDFTRLLQDYGAILEHAKNLAAGYSGRITITTPLNWLPGFLEPVILRFSQQYPKVKVEVTVCEPERGPSLLRDTRSDLAIGFEPEARKSSVVSKKLFEERLCILMPADHPCAGKSEVSIRELKDERFIVLDLDPSVSEAKTAGELLLLRNHVDPSRMIRVKDLVSIGMTIKQTGALCILMESMRSLGRDYLKSVPLSDPDCRLSLYLMKRKSNSSEAVNAFFDMAQAFQP